MTELERFTDHDRMVVMSEIAKLEKRIDRRFDDLTALMSQFANDVNARFDQQDARFDQQDARFDQQVARFDTIEEQLRLQNEKYDHLINLIDGFVSRIDRYETELAARDHKIERLERWIRQIAKSANVDLA